MALINERELDEADKLLDAALRQQKSAAHLHYAKAVVAALRGDSKDGGPSASNKPSHSIRRAASWPARTPISRPSSRTSAFALCWTKRRMADSTGRPSLRIVALGGGTGLSTLLRGLRDCAVAFEAEGRGDLDIAAIVTVSDDGGSSGRLRRDFDILAPGDIRNCMVALAEDEALLSRLFQYRFSTGEGLSGHSFGNLLLTALSEVTGDFHQAIKLSSEVLAIRGTIYPSTLVNVKLEATLTSGERRLGESSITGSGGGIRRMQLQPRRCEPIQETLEAIAAADLITLGPGSLYTSVIPNLLVDGVANAIERSRAPKAYVCNLMWEPGETEGYSAADHLQSIFEHSRPGLVDYVIVNREAASAAALARYAAQHAQPVAVDDARLAEMGVDVRAHDVLDDGDVLRHDPLALARILVDIALEARGSD